MPDRGVPIAMSEQPVEQQEATGARGSNVFTHKLGPLPMWAWMGIGLAIALGYYFWKQNKSNSSTSPPDQTTAASQIPQFVNQTFTNSGPPSTPAPPPPVDTDTDKDKGGGGKGKGKGISVYRTNGKETLSQISKRLDVSSQDLIATTINHPGNVNGGKFMHWLQTSRHGAKGKVPEGLTLYYTPEGTGATS